MLGEIGRDTFRVSPWFAGDAEDDKYDLLIASCGYETRSRAIAERISSRVSSIAAIKYDVLDVFSYTVNEKFFESVGRIISSDPTKMVDELREELERLLDESDKPDLRVAVDISSMDRDRLAAIVRFLLNQWRASALRITFMYVPGRYDPGLLQSSGSIRVNRPVKGFEGWSSEPDEPLICLIGLGFEDEFALAAVETLEPSSTVAFYPRGIDSNYDATVEERNGKLFRSPSLQMLDYEIDQPFSTYEVLESLTHSLVSDHRVVVVPLGPKIFALAALLVAAKYSDTVSVWRVSSGSDRIPEDRLPEDSIVGIRVSSERNHSDQTTDHAGTK